MIILHYAIAEETKQKVYGYALREDGKVFIVRSGRWHKSSGMGRNCHAISGVPLSERSYFSYRKDISGIP